MKLQVSFLFCACLISIGFSQFCFVCVNFGFFFLFFLAVDVNFGFLCEIWLLLYDVLVLVCLQMEFGGVLLCGIVKRV